MTSNFLLWKTSRIRLVLGQVFPSAAATAATEIPGGFASYAPSRWDDWETAAPVRDGRAPCSCRRNESRPLRARDEPEHWPAARQIDGVSAKAVWRIENREKAESKRPRHTSLDLVKNRKQLACRILPGHLARRQPGPLCASARAKPRR